jgi:alkylated DNA repair dioxygenase AlkB
MNSLFQSEPIFLNLPDSEIIYYPNFINDSDANLIFSDLLQNTNWQQDEIIVYGKKHLQPRLTALYGDVGKTYSYSNIKMITHNWTPTLLKLKYYVESICESNFNMVLLNHYRNGNDGNGWHSDNEKELGINPIIASLSFGASRVFKMKHISNISLKKNITLEHGSLLIMKGSTQQFWKHQIPKTSLTVGSRINLTFRFII